MAKRNFSNLQYLMMFVEAIVIVPLVNIISFFCPYDKIYNLSKKIGAIILIIAPIKQKIIGENLAIIFPEKKYSVQEIKEISLIIVSYEFRILLEMISFSKMNFQEIISYIRIIQSDQIASFYHAQSTGVVSFSLHYGNWELLGSVMNQVGIPLACLVERQFNPWIDKYLQFLRKKLGIKTVYNEISQMRSLLTYMRNKGSVALVADQTYWFDPLFIPFFNKEAAVPQGTASLALKMNSSLCFGYSQYISAGIYAINLDMNIISNYQKNKLSVEQLMKIVYHRYEEVIKQDVTNWYTLGSDRWALTKESLKEWNKNPDSSRF